MADDYHDWIRGFGFSIRVIKVRNAIDILIGYSAFKMDSQVILYSRQFAIWYIGTCLCFFSAALTNIQDALQEMEMDRIRAVLLKAITISQTEMRPLSARDLIDNSEMRSSVSKTLEAAVSNASIVKLKMSMKGDSISLLNGSSHGSTHGSSTSSGEHSGSDVSIQDGFVSRLKGMSEDKFVLELLLLSQTLDKKKHIDPIVKVSLTTLLLYITSLLNLYNNYL